MLNFVGLIQNELNRPYGKVFQNYIIFFWQRRYHLNGLCLPAFLFISQKYLKIWCWADVSSEEVNRCPVWHNGLCSERTPLPCIRIVFYGVIHSHQAFLLLWFRLEFMQAASQRRRYQSPAALHRAVTLWTPDATNTSVTCILLSRWLFPAWIPSEDHNHHEYFREYDHSLFTISILLLTFEKWLLSWHKCCKCINIVYLILKWSAWI